MKKNVRRVVCAVGLCLVTGCSSTGVNMNLSRSVARSTGDVASTVVLDKQTISKEKLIETLVKITEFLDKTEVSDGMTREELIALIKENINNPQLDPIVDKLAFIVPDGVDVARMKVIVLEFIRGLMTGATEFDINE